MIIDPFGALMFLAMGLAVLIIVYRVRMNMAIDKVFHNPSYQLGMVFMSACWALVLGTLGLFFWIMS